MHRPTGRMELISDKTRLFRIICRLLSSSHRPLQSQNPSSLFRSLRLNSAQSEMTLPLTPGSSSTRGECHLIGHSICNCNRNRKLLISRAPTKAKSQEPVCSQALNQNKIARQWSDFLIV